MRAQTQWRTFLRESPAYPTEGFAGRGIAILAGGLTYMVPAWVNIHMLRRAGQPLIHSPCVSPYLIHISACFSFFFQFPLLPHDSKYLTWDCAACDAASYLPSIQVDLTMHHA